jgi:hypothetical protein
VTIYRRWIDFGGRVGANLLILKARLHWHSMWIMGIRNPDRKTSDTLSDKVAGAVRLTA